MSKPGRNDLCSCGSGQKYKKCCLAKNDQFESRRREEKQAIQTAIDWLQEKYPEEAAAALHFDFMDEPDEEREAAIDALSERFENAVDVNIGEWLLADAELIVNDQEVAASELILGKGGPLLTAHGREWLQELAKRPLRLYEVKAVLKEKGLILTDMLHPDLPPVEIREKAATRFVRPWDTFGARLLWQDDSFVMSGAVYPMDRETALDCLAEITSELEHENADAILARYMTTCIIIDCWLNSQLEIRPLPELVDAGTGEKIHLTTDHYRVKNWPELERVLAEQDDVTGDRNEGWNRFVELEEGQYRTLAYLLAKGADSLEVFCNTPGLADEAREWLEGLAGGTIQYKIRELVDPRSEKVQSALQQQPESEIPQEVQRQILHQYLAKHYATWPEIALPALNGKTPLAAVKDKDLRPALIELLKSIDQLEAGRIEETGGDPFDVSFLWTRLGVERK